MRDVAFTCKLGWDSCEGTENVVYCCVVILLVLMCLHHDKTSEQTYSSSAKMITGETMV